MGARSLVAAVLCLLAFFTFSVSASNQGLTGLTIADIPACGLQCLFAKVPASGCLPTDIDCVCENNELTRVLADCMLANCTMQEALDTSRAQADLCHLSNESKTNEVILYTAIVYSIAFVCVALRIIGKIVSKRLSWDDLVVVSALAVVTIPLGTILDMAGKGFGEHLWNLQDGMLQPILLRLYISWTIYIVVLCLIKVSIVFFYLQIFPTSMFRKVAYCTLAFIISGSVAVFFVSAFPCKPMNAFWNRDVKGTCINIQAGAYAISALALVQDVVLLIIPLVFLRNIQMKLYRKIAVGIMFSIGTFGGITTVMRLPSLSTFKISIDPTWDYVSVTRWSQLELAAGFVCVSLPTIRVLLAMMIPTRIKTMLSLSSTSKSNSRSNPRSAPPSNNSDKHEHPSPTAWGNDTKISHHSSNTQGEEVPLKTRGRFIKALWPRKPASTHTSNQPQRLNSSSSNGSVAKAAATNFPFRNGNKQRDCNMSGNKHCESGTMETKKSRASMRQSCRTCNEAEEQVTALPYMGCIPERSYSQRKLIKADPTWQDGDMV